MDQADTFGWLRERSNRLEEVEARLVACQLECARLRVRPLVDAEKKGEEVGDLMNMQLNSQMATRNLTLPELNHLQALLEAESESGEYAGPREQYYARTERLIKWCKEQAEQRLVATVQGKEQG